LVKAYVEVNEQSYDKNLGVRKKIKTSLNWENKK